MNLGLKKNSFYDSTDSEGDSSEDEENAHTEVKLKKGKIIRERFLLKKVGKNNTFYGKNGK